MKKLFALFSLPLLCVSSLLAESYKFQALTVSDEKGAWERLPHPVLSEEAVLKLSTRDRGRTAIFSYFELPDVVKTEAEETAFLSGMERSIVRDKKLLAKRDISIDGFPARLYDCASPKSPGRGTITVIFLHQRKAYCTVLQSKVGPTLEDEEVKALFRSIKIDRLYPAGNISSDTPGSYKLQAMTVSAGPDAWESFPLPGIPEVGTLRLATRDRSKVAAFVCMALPDTVKTEADEAVFLPQAEKALLRDQKLLSQREIVIDGVSGHLYHYSPTDHPESDALAVIFFHQRKSYSATLLSTHGNPIEDEEVKTLFSSIKFAKPPVAD